jgi:hypothetical protein
MDQEVLSKVAQLAGPQRSVTFCQLARECYGFRPRRFVETGCYRGISGDGHSTLVLGILAQEFGGELWSYDIYQGAVDKAKELVAGFPVTVSCQDSVNAIRVFQPPIDVLYLDSYDYEEADPGPCQAHQLLEAAAALPKMSQRSLILLDDCSLPGGGKARLSDILIRAMGWQRWRPDAQLYQNLYFRT